MRHAIQVLNIFVKNRSRDVVAGAEAVYDDGIFLVASFSEIVLHFHWP